MRKRKSGPKPSCQVLIQWSPEFAYALGLLTTDGCLLNDGRHIDFTSKDLNQVLTFKKCLGLKGHKIGKKASGSVKQKKYFRIQFGDVIFFQWLIIFGLMPNKSKTLGVLNVSDRYFFDFLRGCWDGDGSIYAYWDPRWHSSYMFYIAFASASLQFLIWIQNTLIRLVNVEGKITRGKGTFQLRFAKENSEIVFNKMFYADNIPYLHRKFTKAQKIFKINKQHDAQVMKLVNMHA